MVAAPQNRLPPEDVEAIFKTLAAADPEPKTELEYVNAFTLLVAVVLSAQMTDSGVNRATRALFALADSPEKMAALGLERISDHLKTINFHRNKAKNVFALSQMLIDAFNGQVPSNQADLESLPGVGRKTANVVRNVVFKEPTMAVDTHIFRLGNRTGLAPGATPLEVELGLLDVIPEPYRLHAHHWLILHGRYVCKARKPECWRCAISRWCRFEPKTPPPKGFAP